MKAKKNITIYVDWSEQTVYTESELDEAKDDRIEDAYNDERAFHDWLDCNFCASEIFGTDYDEVRSDWRDRCVDSVEDDFNNFEEVNLEVEVDVTKKDYVF
jgi:hypothetical protein